MKKYFPVMAAVFIWVWPPIIIKVLNSYFDNPTQNFYRYLAASITLVIVNLVWSKEMFLRELKNIKKFILPAVLIFLFQITWVKTLSLLSPVTAVLINRSSVLFVILFSFLFFKEERSIIKSKFFIFGALLAVIGVIGVIYQTNNVHFNGFNIGEVFALIGALLWAAYLITIRKIVRDTDPLVVAGIVFTLAVPLFFISSLLLGDLASILDVPAGMNVLLLFSGIFCVGVANAFNFKSIKNIGSALSSIFVLITPFLTGIVSYFIFKEHLKIQQILFGIILITGCAILIGSKNMNTVNCREVNR